MERIRVLVIDDSAFMRKLITDILNRDHRIEVIGTARNGEEGLKKIKTLSPDVVTLDLHMPKMDGTEVLKKVMEDNPLPIIMLSAYTSEGASKTVQAISDGAVDFIEKPSGAISLNIDTIKEEIIKKVIAASKIDLKNKRKQIKWQSVGRSENLGTKIRDTVVAIGTSTGGPRALQQVFMDLPGDFSPPIIIVQHMPKGFTKSLADRLNILTDIHVKEAEDGEILKSNTAYIAPGGYHLKVREQGTALVAELTEEAPVQGHRPSVDALFFSVAELKSIHKIAVVLTGMGKDGTDGIKRLRKKDKQAIILAEAEETSIVYGMPKMAAETGYINYQVPLQQIGSTLCEILKESRR